MEHEIERLRKVYADMGDGELEALAREAYTLTDAAKLALKDEISVRRLEAPLRETPAPKKGWTLPDLDLVVFRTVRDMSEARWLKQVLEEAGVASCLGPDNLYDFDDFLSSFEGGVDFKIVQRDVQRAATATRGLLQPDPEDDSDDCVYESRCPNCHSIEIIFAGGDNEQQAEPTIESEFNWSCDNCGHQWTDDGIQQGSRCVK